MELSTVWNLIIGAFLGALLELILALLFEDKARFYFRRIGRIYQGVLARLSNPDFSYRRNIFQIGKWMTMCYIIEGYSGKYYSAYNISATLDTTPLVLPDDLRSIRQKIEEDQLAIANVKGQPRYYNGPMVALCNFSFSRTNIYEDALLHLNFQLTDYYTFLATAIRLHDHLLAGESIYDKYLSNPDYGKPVRYIATSFGVNLAVVTRDNFLIFGKRGHSGISHYRDLYQVPICESVNPNLDLVDNDPRRIDIYKTAIRGAKEELGIQIDRSDIRFFSLCVDTKYYLYGMSGVIRTDKYSRDDILSRRTMGIQDKWELRELEFHTLDPHDIPVQLKMQGGPEYWHPTSFVSIVQTLINEFGIKQVEESFKKILPY